MRSYFIAMEGIDGSGKSTIVKRLASYFESNGRTVITVRDPGSTTIGDAIREILLNKSFTNMSSHTELYLYLAARAQLAEERIIPALQANNIVISDRYSLSTIVYQSLTGKHDLEKLEQLTINAKNYCTPDITFLLDMPAEKSLERVLSIRQPDRMEARGVEFLKLVRQRYCDCAKKYKNIHVIDAAKSPDQILNEMIGVLNV